MAVKLPLPVPHFSYRWFFPIYENREVQIRGLAFGKQLRDFDAIGLFLQLFPKWECPDLQIVESGRNVRPADQVITVGALELFLDSDRFESVSTPRPLDLPESNALRERLADVIDRAAFRIVEREDKERVVLDSLTRTEFEPLESPVHKDLGIARRVWAGSRWTLTVCGLHGLGTAGAALVVTSEQHLRMIYEALGQLESFDEHDTIEILVEATSTCGGRRRFDLDDVHAYPVRMICRGEMVYDFADGTWRDASSSKLVLKISAMESPEPVEEEDETPGRRVVIRGDLTDLPDGQRSLIERSLRNGASASDADALEVLNLVAHNSDRFSMIHCKYDCHGKGFRKSLPEGRPTSAKVARARLVLLLVVAFALRRRLPVGPGRIKAWFPESNRSPVDLRQWLVKKVRGEIGTGFPPFDEAIGAMWIDGDGGKTYRLRLRGCTVFLKLRL